MSLVSSICTASWALRGRVWWNIPFRTKYLEVSYSQHIAQLWANLLLQWQSKHWYFFNQKPDTIGFWLIALDIWDEVLTLGNAGFHLSPTVFRCTCHSECFLHFSKCKKHASPHFVTYTGWMCYWAANTELIIQVGLVHLGSCTWKSLKQNLKVFYLTVTNNKMSL